MRWAVPVAVLAALFLLAAGIHPEKLPYNRYEARFSDAVLTHWPNALFLRDSLLNDRAFPLWRETLLAGQPFAANPLNKTAYPPQWLVLLLPPAPHLNLLIVLHLLMAGWGMWRWARALGLRHGAAALSALAYSLSPRLIGHTGAGHLDILYALAWWPWLLWSVRAAVRAADAPRSAIIRTALFAGLLLLADVRVSLFALATGGVYALGEAHRVGDWRRLARFIPAGMLFGALAAAVIVPLLAWQPYLNRSQLTLTDAGALAFTPLHFLGLLLPAHRGSIETLTYPGLTVLALAAFGLAGFAPRRRWLLLAGLLLAALYGMGPRTPVWSLPAAFVPGLRWFRIPSRVWLIAALIMPLLAGFGVQHLSGRVDEIRAGGRVPALKRARLAVTGAMTAVTLTGLFALLALPSTPTMGISAVGGGLALGAVLLAALSGRIRPQHATAALIVVTFADLAWSGYQWLEWRGRDVWLEPHAPLAERLRAGGAARIYTPNYALEQQAAAAYGLRLFGGVDPFQLTGVVAAVEAGSGVAVNGYSVVVPPLDGVVNEEDFAQANREATIDTALLAEWRVSHVVATFDITHERLTLLDTVNGIRIYTNLDYTPPTADETIPLPDWPRGWPKLPDAETIRRNDRLTAAAALVSAVAFAFSVLALAWPRVTGRNP